MRWSLKLGRIAGIDIFVHVTFTLVVLWVAFAQWQYTRNLGMVLAEVVFVLALFFCIVLHELGHALTARRYGIATRDITLLPIGGVARLERMPDKPMQEFWVAVAGPAVNVVIAAVLIVLLLAVGRIEHLADFDLLRGLLRGPLLERLAAVNLFLVLFNLLPAFPMDGGRVLRSLLALAMPHDRATAIAATIGQGMALVFGFLGFLGFLGYAANPMLLFIAFFIWIGASQENAAAEVKAGLESIRVRDAMITSFHALDAGDTLERAVALILAGSQHDFPVLADGRVAGVLTRNHLMRALAQHGRALPVTQVMTRDVPVLDANQQVTDVIADLQNHECQCLPVLSGGRLVGLLTAENVGEYLMIRSALRPMNETGFIRR